MKTHTNDFCRKTVSVLLAALLIVGSNAPALAIELTESDFIILDKITNSGNPRETAYDFAYENPTRLPGLIKSAHLRIAPKLSPGLLEALIQGQAEHLLARYEYVEDFLKNNNIAKGYGPKSSFDPIALAREVQEAARPIRETWDRIYRYEASHYEFSKGKILLRGFTPAELQTRQTRFTQLSKEYNSKLPKIEAKYGVKINRLEMPIFATAEGGAVEIHGQLFEAKADPNYFEFEIKAIENTMRSINKLEVGLQNAAEMYPETASMVQEVSPEVAQKLYPKTVEVAKSKNLWGKITTSLKNGISKIKGPGPKTLKIGSGTAGVAIIGFLVWSECLNNAKGNVSGAEKRMMMNELIGGTGGLALAGTLFATAGDDKIVAAVLKDYAGDKDELNYWLAEYFAEQVETLNSIKNDPAVKDAIAQQQQQQQETINKNVLALQEALQGDAPERLAGSVGTFS